MSATRRIGIFGGTFNPPHLGHIRAAEAFLEAARLDELLIMPTFLPPHKDGGAVISASDRLNMCKLAFSHLPKTRVSDFEIRKGGKSYTYITLSELSSPDEELFFLVGTDMFLTLDAWRSPETVFSLASIALVRREDDPTVSSEIERKAEEYRRRFGARLLMISADVTEVSSTEIRDLVLEGSDTSELIPACVRKYIDENGIYSAVFSEDELCALRCKVGKMLSPERFKHTLGVERAALKIADYCIPTDKTVVSAAALLHDIAKELSNEELYSLIKSNPELSDEDESAPKLYHAFAAPYVIQRDFSEFARDDLLRAVFCHTTGDSDMTLLDEILFVADYVEEGRQYPECIRTRDELFSELDKSCGEKSILALHRAALSEICATKEHLIKKGLYLNSRTVEAEKYIKSEINKIRGK